VTQAHHRTREFWICAGLLYGYTLAFVLPMFRAYLSSDHITNIYFYLQRPGAFWHNFLFWSSYHRPLGGLVTLTLYRVFGLNPLGYQIVMFLLFSLNLALIFTLLWRLTRNVWLAAVAAAIGAIHHEYVDIWFNFGAIFELLAFGFMMIAFHLYLSFLETSEPRRRRMLYLGALASYILALNGKEAAAVLPAILLVYEALYRFPIGRMVHQAFDLARRLGPFFVVAGVCAAGKIFSQGSMAGEQEAYRYHLDGTILRNLGVYVQAVLPDLVPFERLGTIVVVVSLAGLALVLRSRHMLFGWCFFLIALLPVLGLPRHWGLFLYIPMAGGGLYAAALLVRILALLKPLGRLVMSGFFSDWEISRRRVYSLGLLVLLGTLVWLQHDQFRRASRNLFVYPGRERAAFSEQLLTRYAKLPEGSALLFVKSPFEDWTLHMFVWLRYGTNIDVFAGPTLDVEKFQAKARSATAVHAFDYRDKRLEEIRLDQLQARLAGAKEVDRAH